MGQWNIPLWYMQNTTFLNDNLDLLHTANSHLCNIGWKSLYWWFSQCIASLGYKWAPSHPECRVAALNDYHSQNLNPRPLRVIGSKSTAWTNQHWDVDFPILKHSGTKNLSHYGTYFSKSFSFSSVYLKLFLRTLNLRWHSTVRCWLCYTET